MQPQKRHEFWFNTVTHFGFGFCVYFDFSVKELFVSLHLPFLQMGYQFNASIKKGERDDG